MSILDLPIRVDREAERISTHNGGATADFNGNEEQRREAMRFYEQAPALARATLALARFVEAFDAKPVRGIDDVLYGIHGGDGMPGGADVRLSDLRRLATVLRDAGVMSPADGRGEG